MKLKDYADYINQLLKEGYGDFEVISSSDDEGNSFQKIHNSPSLMEVEDINEYYLEPTDGINYNCICIN